MTIALPASACVPAEVSSGSSDRIARALFLATLGAYAVHAIAAIAAGRHLYGDAAWFVARLASDGRPYSLVDDPSRYFYRSRAVALWLTQGPAALALRLGMRDLSALSTIVGSTYFLAKIASLVLCWRLLRPGEKLFVVFPVLGLFAGSINSDPYIVSEVHVATSFAWPILLALRREEPRGWLEDVLLGLAILASCLLYEAFALLAAAMLSWLAWRAWIRPGATRDPRAPWLTALLAVSVAVNALGILRLPRPQKDKFVAGLLGLAIDTFGGLRSLHVGPLVSVISVAAVLVVTFRGAGGARFWRSAPVLATALFLALAPFHRTSVVRHELFDDAVNDRAFSGVLMQLLVMGAFLAVDAFRREAFHRAAGAVAALVGALALGQVARQLYATQEWRMATASLRRRLDAGCGLLTCPDPGGRSPADQVLCRWWVTPLSLVLSKDAVVRSVMLSDEAFQVFDPRNRAELPSLRFVRADYAPFLDALPPRDDIGPSERVLYGAGGRGAGMLREGFSRPEAGGTWTNGERATLRACGLAIPARASIRLTFRVLPFAPPGGPPPEVTISAGGAPLGTWRFSPGDGLVEREVELPATAIPPGGCVELEFRIRNARSPAALGLSADTRLLGLHLVELQRRDFDGDRSSATRR